MQQCFYVSNDASEQSFILVYVKKCNENLEIVSDIISNRKLSTIETPGRHMLQRL